MNKWKNWRVNIVKRSWQVWEALCFDGHQQRCRYSHKQSFKQHHVLIEQTIPTNIPQDAFRIDNNYLAYLLQVFFFFGGVTLDLAPEALFETVLQSCKHTPRQAREGNLTDWQVWEALCFDGHQQKEHSEHLKVQRLTRKRGKWTPIRAVSPEHCRGNSAGVGRTRCASAASSRRCWISVCSRYCRASTRPRPRSATRRLGSSPSRPRPAPRSPPSASSRPAGRHRETRRRCGISAPCWKRCRHGDPLLLMVLMLMMMMRVGTGASITARERCARWGTRSQ